MTAAVMISLIRIGPSLTPKMLPVSELTPSQEKLRTRFELLIGAMAPALDVVLAAGDRISRLVEPEDHGYYPARPLADDGDRGPHEDLE
jgi:hypothetical protein